MDISKSTARIWPMFKFFWIALVVLENHLWISTGPEHSYLIHAHGAYALPNPVLHDKCLTMLAFAQIGALLSLELMKYWSKYRLCVSFPSKLDSIHSPLLFKFVPLRTGCCNFAKLEWNTTPLQDISSIVRAANDYLHLTKDIWIISGIAKVWEK